MTAEDATLFNDEDWEELFPDEEPEDEPEPDEVLTVTIGGEELQESYERLQAGVQQLQHRAAHFRTRKEFERKLDLNPEDWNQRRVYADWLEDEGRDYAETQRWMAENRKRPHVTHWPGRGVRWWWMGGSYGDPAFLKWVDRVSYEFDTRLAAEIWLHEELQDPGRNTRPRQQRALQFQFRIDHGPSLIRPDHVLRNTM